jgi:Fur family peroxide stress response transcriptional regulator
MFNFNWAFGTAPIKVKNIFSGNLKKEKMNVPALKKSKNSRQRELILQILRSTKSHPSANWIFEKARKQISNISLGTVYRNLNMLKEEGRIREISFGKGIGLYDGDLRNHDHVCCVVCGRVEDAPHLSQPVQFDEIEKLMGYSLQAHRLEFFGVCPQCRNHEKIV